MLERSPAQLARVALGLAARPGAVTNPWAPALALPETTEEPLPEGMTAQELYAKHQGRLLLLGAPGAGKTTLLLELARDLLDQAVALLDAEPEQAAGEPLPVVFHLATWASSHRPLAAWLVEELQTRYGLPARWARSWVAHQQVAPLLDGLDEVAEAHRGACVAAINQFAGAHGQLPVVVCSRTEEFDALATRVRLSGAVVIRPLGRPQIERWLRDGGRALAGLRAVLRDDQVLWELLDSPLLLSVVTLAYLGQPAARIRAAGDVVQRRRRLFADFVAAMLTRERTRVSRGWPYPQEQTLAWLGWLARMLRQRDQSVFYLDWVQPNWLPTRAQRWLASYGIAIAAALGVGLVGGLGGELVGGLAVALTVGLVAGLFVAIDGGLDVKPVQALRWSWHSARSAGLRGLGGGLLGGLVGMLAGGLLGGLAGGLRVGLSAGLLAGLVGGLKVEVNERPTRPGEGIQAAAQNLRASMLVGGLGGGLLGALLGELRVGLGSGLRVGLAGGLIGVVAGGLGFGLSSEPASGGVTWVRHRVVCWLLARNDSLPGDPVRFLDEAADHVLLYRTGGGYLFIHRLLRDYLAEVPPP